MLFQYYPYYSSGPIQNVFQVLVNWGVMDAIFPFIIMFVLLYVILKSITIVSKHATLLALTISLMILVPHILRLYPPTQDPFIVMSTILPELAIILLALFTLFILLGFFGGVPNLITYAIGALATLVLLVTIIGAVYPAFVPYSILGWIADPNLVAFVIVLLTMGGVVYFVARDTTTSVPWTTRFTDADAILKQLFGGGQQPPATPVTTPPPARPPHP